MFEDGDECDVDVFSKCTGCPTAQCLQKQSGYSYFNLCCLGYIFITMAYNISFVNQLARFVMAGIFKRVQSSIFKTFRYHLGSVFLASVIPSILTQKKSAYINTIVHGRSISKEITDNTSRNSLLFFIIDFLASFLLSIPNIVMAGLAISVLSVFILVYSSFYENDTSFQLILWAPLFIIIAFGAIISSSNVTLIYNIALDVKLLDFQQALTADDKEENLRKSLFGKQHHSSLQKQYEEFMLEDHLHSEKQRHIQRTLP
jgi:hypothetical protein